MPNEIYTFVFSSLDGKDKAGSDTNLSEMTYSVDFASMLPREKNRYLAKVFFRGYHDTQVFFLNIEIEGIQPVVWDTRRNGRSNFMTLAPEIYGDAIPTGEFVFANLGTESEGVMIERPIQNYLTIKIKEGLGNTLVDIAFYKLILQLTPRSNP